MPRKAMKSKNYKKGRKGYRKAKLYRSLATSKYNANSIKQDCTWISPIQAYGYGQPGNPYVYFSGSMLTNLPCAIKNTQQFVLYRKLYDQYRVTAVTMKFKPQVTQLTLNDVSAVISDNVIYSAFDIDSPIPSSIRGIQNLASCRQHRATNTLTRTYKYKYPGGTWLDTTTEPGANNSLALSAGWYANWGFYGEFPNSTVENPFVGQIEVIYHCVFRGPAASSIGYDPQTDIVVLGTQETVMKPQTVTATSKSEVQVVNVTGLQNVNLINP